MNYFVFVDIHALSPRLLQHDIAEARVTIIPAIQVLYKNVYFKLSMLLRNLDKCYRRDCLLLSELLLVVQR